MEAVEFGKDNRRKIMLIPGNMMSWRQFERVIPLLEKDFHVVAVWYGAKEPNMKKAVQKLKRAFPNAELHPFPGFGHGEIIAHPDRMAAEIKRFMGGNTL